jgi:hypothetical protein
MEHVFERRALSMAQRAGRGGAKKCALMQPSISSRRFLGTHINLLLLFYFVVTFPERFPLLHVKGRRRLSANAG